MKGSTGHTEPPDSGQPVKGLGKALRTASSAYYRHLRDELAQDGVSYSEFQHLNQLWRSEALTQVELARRIGIGRASSTLVLDRLEQRGLIERVRDVQDRRAYHVRLTEEGRALKTCLSARAAVVTGRALDGMTVEEVALLFDFLGRVVGNLSEST